MEFVNLTPFDALCFSAIDKEDRENKIIVLKVGYRLLPAANGNSGEFEAVVNDDSPLNLCMSDEYFGEPNESSVRQESDLAPHKPLCDFLVYGSAHAPGGHPAKSWDVRVRVSVPAPREEQAAISPPEPLAPGMQLTSRQARQWQEQRERLKKMMDNIPAKKIYLDKSLRITGKREFRRRHTAWALFDPEPITKVTLCWENSFGGNSVVLNPKYGRQADAKQYLLNEVCYSNPVGCGWIESRYLSALGKAKQHKPDWMPAPQIVSINSPTRKMIVASNPKQDVDAPKMTKVAKKYGAEPAGFGALGRAWAPRLMKAGTYDADWLNNRWPFLPLDFDYGYWNCAPEDQQIPYLPADAEIEMWNLIDPAIAPKGYLHFQLPGHRAFVLFHLETGELCPLPLVIDTVRIDTDSMEMALTYRGCIPKEAPIRRAEVRFEINKNDPLLKFKPSDLEVCDLPTEETEEWLKTMLHETSPVGP